MASNSSRFVPEIQALRAIAVMVVFFYHVFPNAVTGGYVGVDIFFVISGYLMTQILLGELEERGRIDLKRFYFRRLRRIIPAATVVLLAVIVGAWFLIPVTMLQNLAKEVVASGLWVENWQLVQRATDYLAGGEDLSPVVHYWSLSIEEQFYLFYPLFLFLCWKAGPGRRKRMVVGLGVAAMIGVSFIHSIVLTSSNASAYFFTTARVWELAAGGLLYFGRNVVRLSGRMYDALAVLGLAGIAYSTTVFSDATPFPGWIASIPVVSTCLLIFIFLNAPSSGSLLMPALRARPVQLVGDLSYSIYLWHWPICVFSLNVVNQEMTPVLGLAVFCVTFILSWLTKIHVEDRFRKVSLRDVSFGAAVVRSGAVIGLIGVLSASVFMAVEFQGRNLAHAAIDRATHPGATVFVSGREAGYGVGEYAPHPLLAKQQAPACYADNYHLSKAEVKPRIGVYGDPAADKSVFLVGDSHAAHWLPALREIAKKTPLKIYHTTKSACLLCPDVTPVSEKGIPYTACTQWARLVMEEIRTRKPTVVVMSNIYQYKTADSNGEPDTRAFSGCQKKVIDRIQAMGSRVLVIANTPHPGFDVPNCLDKLCTDCDDCSYAMESGYEGDKDMVAQAARQNGKAVLLDMSRYLCPDGVCPPIIGNVLVYRDKSHLTVEFSKTMAPLIAARLLPMLEGDVTLARQ